MYQKGVVRVPHKPIHFFRALLPFLFLPGACKVLLLLIPNFSACSTMPSKQPSEPLGYGEQDVVNVAIHKIRNGAFAIESNIGDYVGAPFLHFTDTRVGHHGNGHVCDEYRWCTPTSKVTSGFTVREGYFGGQRNDTFHHGMKVGHLLGGPQVSLQVHIATSYKGRGRVTWTDILQEMVGHKNTCYERTTLTCAST